MYSILWNSSPSFNDFGFEPANIMCLDAFNTENTKLEKLFSWKKEVIASEKSIIA